MNFGGNIGDFIQEKKKANESLGERKLCMETEYLC